MKRLLLSIALATAVFSTGAMAGPSAKFAAVYGDGGPYLVSMVEVSGSVDATDFDQKDGYTMARIKVPQGKEVLVGVSAEIGLATDTSIKGKEGGKARAIAGASGAVVVVAHPVDGGASQTAKPGSVILASRVQQLDATLGGVFSCEDTNGDDIINYSECDFTDEEIGLLLETTSANHFNFVLPDMDQGEYDITAYFTTRAEATICADGSLSGAGEACEGFVPSGTGTVSARAYAKAYVGKYMMTAQTVRAVNGSIENADIIEIVD